MDSPKLKLAFFASRSWSDAEQVLWWLARGLHELGHEVIWVCPNSLRVATEARTLGQTCFAWPGSALQLLGWLGLYRELRRIGVDCIIENDGKKRLPSLWARRQWLNIPRLVLQHDLSSYISKVDPFSVRVVANDSSQVWDPSRSIRVGLWPGKTGPKSEARRWCLASLKLPEETQLICSLQGLCYTPQNDEHFHSHLLEAVNHLRWHMDSFYNVILSDDRSIARSKKLAEVYNLNRYVRFVRKDSLATEWLLGSDVAVCGQGNLGYSIPQLVSNAARTPILNLGSLASDQRLQDPGATAAWLLHAIEARGRSANTPSVRLHQASWNAIDMSAHMEQILKRLIGLPTSGQPVPFHAPKSRLAG